MTTGCQKLVSCPQTGNLSLCCSRLPLTTMLAGRRLYRDPGHYPSSARLATLGKQARESARRRLCRSGHATWKLFSVLWAYIPWVWRKQIQVSRSIHTRAIHNRDDKRPDLDLPRLLFLLARACRSPRQALNFAYALSFLKQEMNMFVGVPPPVLQNIPPLIAEIAGYTEKEFRWVRASDCAYSRASKAVANL